MGNKVVVRAFAILSFFPLTACDQGSEVAATASPPSRPEAQELRGDAGTDGAKPLAVQVQRAVPLPQSSWQETLRRMPYEERAYLESLNARYLGLLEFNSQAEWKELSKAGFPSPEAWISARSQTDRQLKELADGGDQDAQLFYADRQLSRYLDSKGRLTGYPKSEMSHDFMRPQTQAVAYASGALRYSKTPLAAYMYGIINESVYGDPEARLAGILNAGRLGDYDRAHETALRLTESKPSIDPAILASYDQTMSKLISFRRTCLPSTR